MKIIKITKEVNLVLGFFLVRGMTTFLAVGCDSSLSPGFPINV